MFELAPYQQCTLCGAGAVRCAFCFPFSIAGGAAYARVQALAMCE
jgi:hypothetical protein